MIDYTLGNTILLTSHADALVNLLADQGISPDITLDPDTFAGRLFVIMTGSTNALVLDQKATIISLPQTVPESLTGLTIQDSNPCDTKEMDIVEAETIEIPALRTRKEFLDRLNHQSQQYMVNGRQAPKQGHPRNNINVKGVNTWAAVDKY